MCKKTLYKFIAAALAALLFVMPLTGCSSKVPATVPEETTAYVPTDYNPALDPRYQSTEAPETKDPKADGTEDEIWAEHMNVIAYSNGSPDIRSFSFDESFMAYLAEHADGNYMASPLSFRYALGLLLAGAEGETKAELLKALGVENEQAWVDECLRFNYFVELFEADFNRELENFRNYYDKGYIPADSKAPSMALRVANSVWRNEDLDAHFTEAYEAAVSGNYAAEYRTFHANDAAKHVNDWVNKKTEGMIEKLLPEDYDAGGLAIILMNALYFKDFWVSEFQKRSTKKDDFTTKSGTMVQKEFMNQQDHFLYYEDEKTQLVILPMKGGVSMVFVLGDDSGLAEKINKAEYRLVSVTIPKLDLETTFDQGELVDFLKANGVELAFNAAGADFSGMIDCPVYVDNIIQKTRIKLDEEGVEAAAATVIEVPTSMYQPDEPVEFRADRPFSFAIYANVDGTMATLFAGQIVE